MEKLEIGRYFDAANKNWNSNPEYNLLFLRAQERYFNDLLKVRGHVFLNEIYDALGFDRTLEGQTTGWALGVEGDDVIDFGIRPPMRNDSIGLSFNINGEILSALQ